MNFDIHSWEQKRREENMAGGKHLSKHTRPCFLEKVILEMTRTAFIKQEKVEQM